MKSRKKLPKLDVFFLIIFFLAQQNDYDKSKYNIFVFTLKNYGHFDHGHPNEKDYYISQDIRSALYWDQNLHRGPSWVRKHFNHQIENFEEIWATEGRMMQYTFENRLCPHQGWELLRFTSYSIFSIYKSVGKKIKFLFDQTNSL